MLRRLSGDCPERLMLGRITFLVLLAILGTTVPASHTATGPVLPRLEKHTPGAFDQVLRENALFFNMLVTFSFTAAIVDPAWGLRVKDINVNLITRAVRDSRGHQFVRVRVAGVVRKNSNVELDILNEKGSLVGKGFFGYQSGQLTFYDRESKAIIDGFMDSRGNFILDDLRLPAGKQELSNGYVDPCFTCSYMRYRWWDGLNFQVGGGRIFPTFLSDRIRMYWTFEQGHLKDRQSAAGEAEYDLAAETTGAINSVLFDGDRTAESFFANPYSQVPEPEGKSLIPRFTDDTGIAVTNPTNREALVTYIARHYDGSLVTGNGIENPVTYRFAPGQQYTAYPADIFRGLNAKDRRPILKENEVGWIEIFSDDTDVQAMYLNSDVAGTALDGNLGGEVGSDSVIFPDLRLGSGETTEITLLNLAYDDIMVRLELLDREGNVLREEPEYFIAGYGIRNFFLGRSSSILRVTDPSQAASLRVICNNNNSLRSSSCSKLLGVATYTDRFNSLSSAYAVSAETAGSLLVAPHFVTGRAGNGEWETKVNVVKLSGSDARVYLDLYDAKGNLLDTIKKSVTRGGQVIFDLNGSTLAWGERLTTGYLRLSSDSGDIAGDVSLSWSDGTESLSSTYPLYSYLSKVFQFNQVAQGVSGGIEYYTGIALMNDYDRRVTVKLKVIREDGKLDRTATVTLEPYQQIAKLLPQILDEKAYKRLDGYIQVSASEPISAIVFYGDVSNRFLAAVPGIPR